jgi:HK97 gp10 family phage protein
MATLKVKLPDDLMIGLERLSKQADAVVKKTLEAGAEVVEEKVRANLKNSLSGESSGQLLGALGISPVKPNDKLDGWDIKVGFNEPRKDYKGGTTYKKKLKSGKVSEYKLTNAMVANILEYGKRGQAAKPFMKPAEDAAKAKARAVMKRVFSEEANKIVK